MKTSLPDGGLRIVRLVRLDVAKLPPPARESKGTGPNKRRDLLRVISTPVPEVDSAL